jgi:DNA-directed RNA polymerase specialized sigma24 family protein
MNANALRPVNSSQSALPAASARRMWVVPTDGGQPETALVDAASSAFVDDESRRMGWLRLLTFLARGQHDMGGAYERTRTRLIEFFVTKGARDAEDLTDLTFERLARKLNDEHLVIIEKPLGYVLRFGRFIYLESINTDSYRRRCLQMLLGEPEEEQPELDDDDDQQLAALRCCLADLEPGDRALLVAYYEHGGRDRIQSRSQMCRALGLTPGLLRTRVARLRARLEQRLRAQLVG